MFIRQRKYLEKHSYTNVLKPLQSHITVKASHNSDFHAMDGPENWPKKGV
jgi:hypothetical protein